MLVICTSNHYTGYRIAIKLFGKGQDYISMLGYILKDENRPHYSKVETSSHEKMRINMIYVNLFRLQ